MKSVFWFLFLAALAVALALLVGGNGATVSLFWPPHRVDVSFNLVLFALAAGFVVFYLALRALALLRRLPQQAKRWRKAQLERAVYAEVLDALAYQLSGRFVRARAAAERAIGLMQQLGPQAPMHRAQLDVLSHLLAAEAAHALGDVERRDAWLQVAVAPQASSDAEPAREGALLRVVDWALKARDAEAAHRWMAEWPQGLGRRILAVRLRLQLAQLRQDTPEAIDMVRLLAKHRAFSREAADSLLRGLLLEALRGLYDRDQLLHFWQGLDGKERHNPDVALAWLERWQALSLEGRGQALLADALEGPRQRPVLDAARQVWAGYEQLSESRRRRLVCWLETALPALGSDWLAQVEQAQRARPSDPLLQYLAGQAFLQHQLWGKAGVLLELASKSLPDAALRRRTWCSLARLAEQRGDVAHAQLAWKEAALSAA